MIETGRAYGIKAGLPLLVVRKEVFYISEADRADEGLRLRDQGIYAVISD